MRMVSVKYMMQFKNNIQFEHGQLKRGEGCLWKGFYVTYMGSYSENFGKWIHMLRLEDCYTDGNYPIIEQHIVQEEDRSNIICKARESKPEKGQMQLC